MRRLIVVLLSTAGLLLGGCAPVRTAAQSPPAPTARVSESGEAAPSSGSSHFHLLFEDDFNTPVPKGDFADCAHDVDTPQAYCADLPASVRADWWAYPSGWPDTASEDGYRVHGSYDPASDLWISPVDGDGQLHIRLWRSAAGGPVHSAAVVPKKLMDRTYGKFEERFRVSRAAPGFKGAHMLWPQDDNACPNCEDDFAEGDWDGRIWGYAHHQGMAGGAQDQYTTGATWTSWHTTDIVWTPGSVEFLLDGKVVGRSTRGVPDQPMSWIIQNESALNGPSAAPGSWAQLDITYVKGWSYS
ncbi:glycoside hydrolase family 16 protein [Streptomyces sp. PTM05]|uniref:Glycoside hydrolase family 16 protein n=1 Tax=Streptantibioticus parmotrematis TaxID=2873249 RepID=A0ABS7QMG1_9ACTN|nr:glycoside hydrolase family 16 protein [Streptantibioticus parmotrematis]MBY8884376.1 glycoside hydrolase family 16 protein [Streptantibioticus parmotrematis]